MDSHGLSGVGRGVYKPCFLVVGLAIVQAVQDLIYLPTSCRSFASRNVSVASPLSFRCRSVLPPDCSGLPRSALLAHLMEHRYGPDDTTTHPEDGNYRQLHLHPTFGRWWRSQGLSHRVGAIHMSHGCKSLAPW
jgi:hypothetical protein